MAGRNLNLKENFTISLFYFSGHGNSQEVEGGVLEGEGGVLEVEGGVPEVEGGVLAVFTEVHLSPGT